MKRKTRLSVMMALLMVISSVAIIPASVQGGCPPLVVTKTMRDGENWVSELYDVVKGDIVQFNITVTFYNYHPCQNNYAYDIVVEDYLPDGLAYGSTIEPREPDEIVDNKLVWNFTDNEIILHDGESFSIVFNAIAVEYGEQVNDVDVTAIDFCSGEPLSAESSATVHVDPRLDAEKKVWDPDEQEWVEHLESVIKAVDVQFQITITYYGLDIITCMEATDTLEECECECLEYRGNEEFIYPNGELFEDPEITVSEDLKEVVWNWGPDILFNLKDGESVVILYDANVTDYCYCYCPDYCIVTNLVEVEAKSCETCSAIYGDDTATVTCQPHDPVFEKKVKYEKSWAEETTARIDDIVTFKIELTYYGNYNLSDIRIVDQLPKNILIYADDAELTVYHYYEHGVSKESIEGDVSEDETKIWWNLSEALNDSDSLAITFKARVVGLSGDCEDCGKNIAEYTAIEAVTETPYDGSDDAMVKTFEKIPVKLGICIKRFGIGRVRAVIHNIGQGEVSDLEWSLSVEGRKFSVSAEGDNHTIPEMGSLPISLSRRSILRKFGRITVNVTATVDGETFTETANGFVFGRIILVRPLIRFR